MAVQSKAGSDSQADINLPVEDQDTKYENTPPPPPSITVLCQQQSTQNTYYHDVVNGTKDNPIS